MITAIKGLQGTNVGNFLEKIVPKLDTAASADNITPEVMSQIVESITAEFKNGLDPNAVRSEIMPIVAKLMSATNGGPLGNMFQSFLAGANFVPPAQAVPQ